MSAGPYVSQMTTSVSIEELRDSTAGVISRLEAGERLVLTVDQRPIADIVPSTQVRDQWIAAAELRRIVDDVPSDPGLLEDLGDVRGIPLDDG
jgi:antitoxin (DNA-binding transcriptional repressor) of toxin-antitoxin stability system